MVEQILEAYGMAKDRVQIEKFGDGLINHTWKLTDGKQEYILQQINKEVFTNPTAIDENLTCLKQFLQQNYPDYLFISPIANLAGQTLVHGSEGYFRLFPFVKGSHSVNVLHDEKSAYEAARQFGMFSALLNEFDPAQLQLTLPDFHNLGLRYQQFLQALENAKPVRKNLAVKEIAFILKHQEIVDIYKELIFTQTLPLRVIHHDTKISNVLFDESGKGLCVIDLDTVMPGYFISDLGDMMRTYLCAKSEEETDLSKISIRKDFFKAICDGYLSQMGAVLNDNERGYLLYAGKFMIYMQAIRFLTDYLQNDIYYGEKYKNHNLNRAANQITLLEKYLEAEPELKALLNS